MQEILKDAIQVIPGRLYFLVAKRPDVTQILCRSGLVLNIDRHLIYEPFCNDFGPLNLGCTYRFCEQLHAALNEGRSIGQPVYFVTSNHPHRKANAAVLIGVWQVLFFGLTSAEAYKPLSALEPFLPFRDASSGSSTFNLTVADCLSGMEQARKVGFVDWNLPESKFCIDRYECFEQVVNGDWNWIVPGKLLAFSGPTATNTPYGNSCTLSCEDYWETFHEEGVSTIVRLNNKQYDRKRFLDGGFDHIDMFFPDGSCPPEHILTQFLSLAESRQGALAVHCKAGLGRTGSLIACYIMKHYGFTAEQVMGYIRICRPGSILGPQQNYLKIMQPQMWNARNVKKAASTTSQSAPTPPNSVMWPFTVFTSCKNSNDNDTNNNNNNNSPTHTGSNADPINSNSSSALFASMSIEERQALPTTTYSTCGKEGSVSEEWKNKYGGDHVKVGIPSGALQSETNNRHGNSNPAGALSAASKPSCDINNGQGWRSSSGDRRSSHPGRISANGANLKGMHVAHTVAPNGQPRKIMVPDDEDDVGQLIGASWSGIE